jgi:7,8-dihydro-6-hydroxymethylpterin dimethyltransferase
MIPSQSIAMSEENKRMVDCMVCGTPLVYFSEDRLLACAYCGRNSRANAACEQGHYVCDGCHAADALEVILQSCLATGETDMFVLMDRIAAHPSIPLHGPEYHGLAAGVVLSTYRNLGGTVTPGMIETGISRGGKAMGGACGFTGACGAVTGIGVAFSLILDANPLKPVERQHIMRAVSEIAAATADILGARCCRRDTWVALKKGAELSATLLPIPLQAGADIGCAQQVRNAECIGERCPLVSAHARGGCREREENRSQIPRQF